MFAGVPVQGILFTVFQVFEPLCLQDCLVHPTQSISQVFLLCLAGYMLSFKGIVDKPTSKV